MLIILIILLSLIFPSLASATIIDQQEWTTWPGGAWSRSFGTSGAGATPDASPACGGGSSPSGGAALVQIYPAGTYTSSIGGGTATRALSPSLNEFYWGHWICFSPNFVWNNNGTKMDFFVLANPDPSTGSTYNIACGWLSSAGQLGCVNQILWGAQNKNYFCNISACSRPVNIWYWILWRIKANTPGQADGEMDLWINDVHKASHTGIQLQNSGTTGGFGSLQHSGTWGGGGGTIPLMKAWIDHTVLSTAFVPMPGGSTPPDTTAPAAPVTTVSGSGTTNTISWTLVTDASGIASNTVRWCSGSACVPNQTLGVFGTSTLSTTHSGLANSTVYGYCTIATDGASSPNASACSSPTKYVTTGSPPPPPTPPTITGVVVTTSNITVTHGPVVATQIRIDYGDNGGNFHISKATPISDWPGGVYTFALPSGTQFFGACPIDNLGAENSTSCRYVDTTNIIAPIDTNPIVMGSVFPAGIQPAGTTTITYGVPISKPGSCRADSVNRLYTAMDILTTAVQMSVSNLNASYDLTGVATPSTTIRYIQCEYINTFGDPYYTSTAAVATLQVAASTVDTTPPGPVLNVVVTPVPNTSNLTVTWDALVDAVAYRVYIASGFGCGTYVYSGQQVPQTSTLLTLAPSTVHCVKVTGVDASGNEDLVSGATAGTATTSSIPDVEPPSIMANLRVKNRFTGSVEFEWATCTDAQGPCFTELAYCAGIGCSNYIPGPARVSGSSAILPLTPNQIYSVKGIHYDLAGNPSGGVSNPTYCAPIQVLTETVGTGFPRGQLPDGFQRATATKSTAIKSLKP